MSRAYEAAELEVMRQIAYTLAEIQIQLAKPPVPREAYSQAEVAEALGVNERTVREQLVQKGVLGHLRVGDRKLVPAAELRRYVADNTQFSGGATSSTAPLRRSA